MPWWYEPVPDPTSDGVTRAESIADRLIRFGSYIDRSVTSPGRRVRAFSLLVECGSTYRTLRSRNLARSFSVSLDDEPSYGQAMAYIEVDDELREMFSAIPLRPSALLVPLDEVVYESIPDEYEWVKSARDPELHIALQDLGYAIGDDLTEACNGFTDPDYYYPGVDEGIEPVTDDHVRLVIWGTMRELKRELRRGKPHAPIDELPWRFQRAFAERRRLRYQQYGIGRAEWESNLWSLWKVPEEPDWIPQWVVK